MSSLTRSALAALIDHTLLKAEASEEQIVKICEEAKTHGFFSVCVNPARVPLAAAAVKGSAVKVCTVIGFPLGANRTEVKAMETVRAAADGADELDVVIALGAVKDGAWQSVEADILAVVTAARGRLVKVILETCLLTTSEIERACQACITSGAQFVKTSTGFSTGGATIEHVSLMRAQVGQRLGVKASGGIRDLATALAMVEAGATRLGTSHGVALIQGAGAGEGY